MSYISILGSILAIGLVIFAIAYPNYKRMKLQEATKGKMYAIITKPGVRITGLFDADDITIDIPVETAKVGEHFKKKDKHINSVTLNPDAIEPIQYPPHSAESNRSWLTKWLNPTVSIRSIMLIEGYGIPIIPSAVDPITGKYIIPEGTAAAYINAFKDQANAGALSRKSREYTEGAKASGGIKKSSFNLALVGIGITLLIVIASAGLSYFILTEQAKITTGFGL